MAVVVVVSVKVVMVLAVVVAAAVAGAAIVAASIVVVVVVVLVVVVVMVCRSTDIIYATCFYMIPDALMDFLRLCCYLPNPPHKSQKHPPQTISNPPKTSPKQHWGNLSA